MAQVELRHIDKLFPDPQTRQDVAAVRDLNLTVQDGEFLVLVGPSGCGKSTALRMIAGLEEATRGEILIGERVVNDVPPRERNIAMVFQSYALYPHMSVYDNMAFSLRLRDMKGFWWKMTHATQAHRIQSEIDKKVREAARQLDIEHLLERKPKQLSGGQRQRVALGRAIVREPQVFLMDEPLSNLDAKLRVQTRAELIKLHRKLGVTTVYVTHDQVEAMTMGQRIAVMKGGVLQQCAPPLELYKNPANVFVAGFIGTPAMNFLPARVLSNDESGAKIQIESAIFPVNAARAAALKNYVGKEILVGIRPEDIHDKSLVEKESLSTQAALPLMVEVVEPMGAKSLVGMTMGTHAIHAELDAATQAQIGESLEVIFDANALHFFDKETEAALV